MFVITHSPRSGNATGTTPWTNGIFTVSGAPPSIVWQPGRCPTRDPVWVHRTMHVTHLSWILSHMLDKWTSHRASRRSRRSSSRFLRDQGRVSSLYSPRMATVCCSRGQILRAVPWNDFSDLRRWLYPTGALRSRPLRHHRLPSLRIVACRIIPLSPNIVQQAQVVVWIGMGPWTVPWGSVHPGSMSSPTPGSVFTSWVGHPPTKHASLEGSAVEPSL